jgi:molybdenum cofactor synthesis domain-containing protein
VRLLAAVKVGQNIMRRGASLTSGQIVLEPGKRIRAIEVGLLAEVGRSLVLVNKWPSVAVLATGNELVDRCEQPGAGQIRNSNGPLLKALAAQAGADAYEAMGPARDNVEDLARCIEPGLRHDVLLLSGGVSAGVLDLVPQVLAELGVGQVFHKVNLKPGKPLWFGVKEHAHSASRTLVFGLPGNPVSTLVCFELFVRPAIEKLSSGEPKGLARVTATLTHDHQQRGERPTYWPAKVRPLDPQLLPHFMHELRTPLYSIIGFSEVLQGVNALDDKQKRYVQNILDSGRMLKELIDDVLQLAKQFQHSELPKTSAMVSLLSWQGSGDLRTLTDANCLAHFPAGDRLFRAGDEVEVLLLPEPRAELAGPQY